MPGEIIIIIINLLFSNPRFRGLNRFGSVQENLVLHQNHFSPFILYKSEAMDDFIRGLTSTPAQKFDRHFTSEVICKKKNGDNRRRRRRHRDKLKFFFF